MEKKDEEKKAVEEAKEILKKIEKTRGSTPKKKNILEWSTSELKAYILAETSGMNTRNKLKFARKVMKRIEDEKKKIKK